MTELQALQLVTAGLTAAAALTLIPHTRRPLGATVEFGVWVAFVLASALCIATFGNAKFQEATASIAWGAMFLFEGQVSFVMGIAGGWLLAHRFVIADWAVLVAGVDVLALALMHELRAVRRTQPRVHLGEWFELPRPAVQPAVVAAADPLAAIDRRLAGAAQAELQLVTQKIETSPAIARAAAGTAHLLGPGHLRLMMVKLALKIRWRREDLAAASVARARAFRSGATALAAGALRRSPHPHPHHRARSPKGTPAAGVIPIKTASQARRGRGGRAKEKASVPALRDRAAS